MPCKNRISVNFSAGMHTTIVDIANNTKISQSKIIETLVSKGLASLNNGTGYAIDDKRYMDRDVLLARYRSAIGRQSISMVKINEASGNNEFDKEYHVMVMPQKIPIKFNFDMEKSKFIESVRGEIRTGEIKKHMLMALDNMLSSDNNIAGVLGTFYCRPDAVLVFATKANVGFSIQKKDNNPNVIEEVTDEKIVINVKVDLVYIPIYTKNNMSDIVSFFDFENISYKTFKDVAVKGWKKSKYSHLLYMDDVDVPNGGGYFVGMTYERIIHDFSTYKSFKQTKHSGELGTTELDTYYRLFCAGMKIKLNKNDKNSLMELLNIRRIEAKSSVV